MNEDICGLGLGVTGLLLAGCCFRGGTALTPVEKGARVLRWCIWLAVAAVCAKATLTAITRVLAPYYLLLFPTLLIHSSAQRAVRSLLWRRLAVLQSLSCIGVLFLLTSTPPWPLLPVVQRVQSHFPQSAAARAFVYAYGTGPLGLGFWGTVGEQLPRGEKVIGIMRNWDAPELGLWEPRGSRLVDHVLPQDDAASLRARGIRHVLVFRYRAETLEQIEYRLSADLERDFVFQHRHHHGHLVHLLKVR